MATDDTDTRTGAHGMQTSFIAAGDSIVYGFRDPEGGWVQRLRRAADERNASEMDVDIRVYNLGIAGETSEDLRVRLGVEIASRIRNGACVVLLGIGINDAKWLQNVGRPHISLERFIENAQACIAQATAQGADIVVLGLTRVDERSFVPAPRWNPNIIYRNTDIERYDAALAGHCTVHGIDRIDLASIGWTADLLEDDGLHPNAAGHVQIFQRVLDEIVRKGLW